MQDPHGSFYRTRPYTGRDGQITLHKDFIDLATYQELEQRAAAAGH